MTPSVISMPPPNRRIGTPKKGGASRQRKIHQGAKPATNPGAMTRKTAEPAIGNTLLTMSSCKQVLSPSAIEIGPWQLTLQTAHSESGRELHLDVPRPDRKSTRL